MERRGWEEQFCVHSKVEYKLTKLKIKIIFYICTGALQSTKQFCIHLVFDPKNPKEADRATGFISASQMKEMRLRETKGFAQQQVLQKARAKYTIQVLNSQGVLEDIAQNRKGAHCKKNHHSVDEILYLKYVSNIFITHFQTFFLITMAMPLLMNSLEIKLL